MEEPLQWEIAAPLLTNRFFLYDMVKAMAWAGVIMTVLMAVLFTLQGEPELVLEMFPVLGIALAVILLLLVFVSAVVFGNRWHVRFEIDNRGISWEQLRRKHWGLLALMASLSGHPTACGAGILATTGNAGRVSWRDIRRVKEHPGQHVISLMNQWRVLVRLYCTAENYAEVMGRLQQRTGT